MYNWFFKYVMNRVIAVLVNNRRTRKLFFLQLFTKYRETYSEQNAHTDFYDISHDMVKVFIKMNPQMDDKYLNVLKHGFSEEFNEAMAECKNELTIEMFNAHRKKHAPEILLDTTKSSL
jgi:hypothetical protein